MRCRVKGRSSRAACRDGSVRDVVDGSHALEVLPGSWYDGRAFLLAFLSCLSLASIPTCPTFIALLDAAKMGKSVCLKACTVENPMFFGNFPVSGLSGFSACAYVTFHCINPVCTV